MADEQLPLFGFRDNLPRVPLKKMVSKERVEEAKRLFQQKNYKGAAEAMRDVRYQLENYCNRIGRKS